MEEIHVPATTSENGEQEVEAVRNGTLRLDDDGLLDHGGGLGVDHRGGLGVDSRARLDVDRGLGVDRGRLGVDRSGLDVDSLGHFWVFFFWKAKVKKKKKKKKS